MQVTRVKVFLFFIFSMKKRKEKKEVRFEFFVYTLGREAGGVSKDFRTREIEKRQIFNGW